MKNLFTSGMILFSFLSISYFSYSQEISNLPQSNFELVSLGASENNQFYASNTPTILIPKTDFEPLLVDCNKCICIRVFSPTKQFKDKAKAVYFAHRCSDPCKGCSNAGGNSSMEWKAHYERVYPDAQSVTIERSTDDQTIKNCGCNPGL